MPVARPITQERSVGCIPLFTTKAFISVPIGSAMRWIMLRRHAFLYGD